MTKYLITDFETSGLPRFDKPADDPSQPHIASAAFLFVDEGLHVEREYHEMVKPDGWTMEAGASAINGLTDEILSEKGLPIAEVIEVYGAAIDEGHVIVAHNAQFDCKMARGELRRVAVSAALASGVLTLASSPEEVNAVGDVAGRFERTPNICTMRGSSEIMRLAPSDAMMASGRKGNKPPKLIEAYKYFMGTEFEGAHGALADARACLEIFRALKKLGKAPEPQVFFAKEGSKSHAALMERKGEGTNG